MCTQSQYMPRSVLYRLIMSILLLFVDNIIQSNLNYLNPRLSELKMQRKCRVKVHNVTTWLDCTCAVNLCRVVATREPATALLSNLVNTQRVKKCKVSVLSIEDEIKIVDMLVKSVIYKFLHAWSISWVWLGRDQRYPNFLLIQTVRNLPLAKEVWIIEVGLYIMVVGLSA